MVWCVVYSTYGMVCGLQYVWYGMLVTVHFHTHETLSVYCRQLCLATFTNLPCPFLSPDATFDDSRNGNFCCLFTDTFQRLSATLLDLDFLPSNEPLQTHQNTLSSVHTFIPNCLTSIPLLCSCRYATYINVDYQNRLHQEVSSTSAKPWLQNLACCAFNLNSGIFVYYCLLCATQLQHTAPVQ